MSGIQDRRSTPPTLGMFLREAAKDCDDIEYLGEMARGLLHIGHRLCSLTGRDDEVRFVLQDNNQKYLVELAMLFPFESCEELVQWIKLVFNQSQHPSTDVNHTSSSTTLPHHLASYEATCTQSDDVARQDDSPTMLESTLTESDAVSCITSSVAASHVIAKFQSVFNQDNELVTPTDLTELGSLPDESVHEMVREDAKDRSTYSDNNCTSGVDTRLQNTADLGPGRDLCGIGEFLPTVLKEAPGRLPLTADLCDGVSSANNCRAISIRKNWEVLDIGRSARAEVEHLETSCMTQELDSRLLNIHRGEFESIFRWRPGSTIPYSVDYDSFPGGRVSSGANYPLFVEPGTDPYIFKLKYISTPMPSFYAISFFPAHALVSRGPLELGIYNNSFCIPARHKMAMTFLHEGGHILGGRHPNAREAGEREPFVELDTTSNDSILASRHPEDLQLYPEDIRSLKNLYTLPEGHEVEGYPICNIDPESVFEWWRVIGVRY